MRRLLLTTALALLAGQPLHAQHLRDKLSYLFIFGSGRALLNLGYRYPAVPTRHRHHGAVAAVVAVVMVLCIWLEEVHVGSNVANVPVSATSGGSTFSFQGGVPTRTSHWWLTLVEPRPWLRPGAGRLWHWSSDSGE